MLQYWIYDFFDANIIYFNGFNVKFLERKLHHGPQELDQNRKTKG